jgi:hypothetical protein
MEALHTLSTQESLIFEAILESARDTFRLDEDEVAQLEADVLVRLLALLPHFAGCQTPVKVGFINITTYIAERRGGKAFFRHTPHDDSEYLSRLEVFRHLMHDGDPAVIDKGLSMAGIIMLNDYQMDAEEDMKTGKYNPLVSGKWQYDKAIKTLKERFQKFPLARMDVLFGLAVIISTAPQFDPTTMAWWKPF